MLMEESKLLKRLQNPATFGPDVKSVKIIQTHISFIALTGKYVYKVKKPVNFGFLDFTTLEKRKHFCEEEIRLNRRLCPEIYLDVVPITQKNDNIEISGDGNIIDYAVKMKEFHQENVMTELLKKGKIDEEILDKIIDKLVQFYRSEKRSKEIDYFGSIQAVKNNIDENFEQTKPFIDLTIAKNIFDFIKEKTNNFLEKRKDLFKSRIKNGFICDCHGDLHSGNIAIDDGFVYIFDCIEFNKRFRFSDVASDIGFLAMDLDFLGYPYLSSYLIKRYIEKSGDKNLLDVLNFYKCYRAYVRGKVTCFKLNDAKIDNIKREKIIKTAFKYFNLAHYYSQLFSVDLKKKKPILFITIGLTGTGKTTVARKIAIDYYGKLISTDTLRKELEGINKYDRHHDAYNTGLYAPEKMLKTYEKILEKAKKLLEKDENVVLDATFKTKDLRKKALKIAEKTKARFLILYTVCPEEVVKKYLEDRLKKKSVSDGRWEIYVKQKNSFEPPESIDNFVEIDISKISYDYQIKVFRKILNKIIEV